MNTSSSGFDSTSNGGNDGTNSDDDNTTNGDDDNTTNGDDDNTTNGDDDNTTNDDTLPDTGDGTSDIFVTDSAIYDSKACLIDDEYKLFLDSSLDPSSSGVDSQGLEVGSFLDFNVDVAKTQIGLYYPDLVLTLEGKRANIFEDDYWFGFDNIWVFNGANTIYIRIPKNSNGLFTCYRYKLDSVNSGDLTRVKVYR